METPGQTSHALAVDAVRTRVFAFNLLPLKASNQPNNGTKFYTEHSAATMDVNSPLRAGRAGAATTSSSTTASAGAQQFLQHISMLRSAAMEILSDKGSSAVSVESAVNRCVHR